ncbi:MAG: hypothetical protein HQK63_06245 [Desulfamplus sp.]|nr:hypothetical protein [Desulfamplus sp.]
MMNTQPQVNTTALAVATPARFTDTILIAEGKGLMPTNFTGLWEMSQIFAVSGMMPKDLVNKPEAVFVAINMGYELGLSPLSAIQNISVINGRPTVWGDAMLAIVRASGKLTKFREYFTGTWANDDFTAVCECSRGNESAVEQFSIADAKTAKLWAYPSAGMTPWHKYPKRMLQMRARSWALRNMFSDVLKGISATEELTEYDIELTPQQDGSYSAEPQTEKKKRTPKATPPKQEQPQPVSYQPVQQTATPIDVQFWKLVNMKDGENKPVHAYIEEIANIKSKQLSDIMHMAVANFERFWNSFVKWDEQNNADKEFQEQATAQTMPLALMDLHRDFPEEFAIAVSQLGISEITENDVEAITKRTNAILDEQAMEEAA